MTQQVVHQRDGHHRLGDRRSADAHARVVAAFGDDVHRVAVDVDRTARGGDAGSRLQCQVSNDRLARRNATQDAAGVVAEEAFRGQLVTVFGTTLGNAGEAGADFHALDRVDAHQRVGQLCVQTVEDRFAQTRHHAFGHHGDFGSHRILVPAQLVHVSLELRYLVRVGAEESVLLHRFPGLERDFDRAQLAHVATHGNALGGQVLLGNGTGSHAHGGFAGRTAATTAVVADAVLVMVGVVGVGRAEQVLDGRVVLGLLVSVANQQADRAARGTAFEHAREDFHLVGFLTLRGVPAGAGLAPVEVVLQVGQGNLQARWASIDNGDQRRAMAFASGGDSEQLAVGIAGHGRSASSA